MSTTISFIKQKIEEKYNVDFYIQIEDLETQPSSTLYRSLLPYVRDPYEPEYRFVFFNFAKVYNQTLEHVLRTINFLDISPSFILIITNQQSTVDFFIENSKDIRPDYVLNIPVVQTQQSTALFPEYNKKNKLCAYAWAGLHVFPTGTIAPCCDFNGEILDESGSPYNIKTARLEEIASSDFMKNLRQEFLKNDTLPEKCSKCNIVENSGGKSRRDLALYKMQNSYSLIDWESQTPTIRHVGGHTGNLCNLKCRICSSTFSSSIAVEEISNKEKVQQLLRDTRWTKNSHQFWDELKTLIPDVRNFEFLGGEPLMLKENIDFIQYLIDQGHSQNCTFELVTNGTFYLDLLDSPKNFYRLTITISIDDINERFEFQRSGAKFQIVEANLDRYIQNKNSCLKIGVNTTVNIQNIFYLPELLSWLDTKNLDHHYFSMLTYPDFLSVYNLTPAAKDLVLSKLKLSNDPRLKSIITTIQQSATSDGKEFNLYMKNKDQLRNENFNLSHSEIAQAMSYKTS